MSQTIIHQTLTPLDIIDVIVASRCFLSSNLGGCVLLFFAAASLAVHEKPEQKRELVKEDCRIEIQISGKSVESPLPRHWLNQRSLDEAGLSAGLKFGV